MKKILVIEDEQSVRESILDLLAAEGFEGIGGENGNAGIQLLQNHYPDLILCDVSMPGMDGFAMLREIRQRPNTSGIPFIFLSARSTKFEVRRGMELGADDYLTKPCTATELLGAISGRLAKHEAMLERYRQSQPPTSVAVTIAPVKAPVVAEAPITPEAKDARDGLLNHFYQELRNPLSGINMALHLLKEDETQPQSMVSVQREYGRELTILQEVFKLQDFLMPESAELLRSCNLFDVFED
jgi:two-component system, OmpR family, alkaline phosphatase synthesis response regulator PhoP